MQTIVLALALAAAPSAPPATVHYHLSATLDPAAHKITVAGSTQAPGGKEKPIAETKTINHPIAALGEDYARGFAETEGTIQPEGVFLSGASGWYPKSGDALVTFDLEVTLPPGWIAMSQGKREPMGGTGGNHVRFTASDPQEEIWLVAGPWKETSRQVDGIDISALLREQDDALAAKYLDATATYIQMYSKLLGPYPYTKFVLVENFWETGYGMPSFTLLGSKVIRLPFIITTSYPHEILHNWFGNGIFVDSKSGNWSEGMTAYLADHMFAEQNGQGAGYRQEALQKYADYASKSKDFPLTEFKERHSPATEAVGYGKALMLFHMMRREIGDASFVKGLRALYAKKQFQRASFDDVRQALEAASGRDLKAAFNPWVTRTGAPRLAARDVKAQQAGAAWHIIGKIVQTEQGDPYELSIPVAVTLDGRDQAFQSTIKATKKEAAFDLEVPAKPLRLDIDPEFDLFRVLDVEEAPPALSGAFGAEVSTMILPAKADEQSLAAYRAMAKEWNTGRTSPMKIVTDAEIKDLPKDGSIWIVGFENRFAGQVAEAVRGYSTSTEKKGDRALVLAARRRKGEAPVIAFVAAARAAQIPGLARKLPHYHKYSHLAFEGDEPVNVDKGRWLVTDSPMTALLSGGAPMASLAPRQALAELPPAFSKDRMMMTINALAAPKMKGRGLATPELDRVASLIASEMRDAGLEVPPADAEAYNVIGVLRGTKPEWSDTSVVVGAHYDHLGMKDGAIHPGADDNASGVAVLLELARQMAESGKPSRTVIFAAFTGEESGLLGSKRYVAAQSTWPAGKCIGMVNLDTVGRLGSGKILVLGSNSADEWIHIVQGAGYVTNAPVQAVMDDPGGSDQKSFIEAGVPAVQVFTGANADYHQPTDTPDKIDPDGLIKVAAVTREIVAYLAERPGPLTSKLGGAKTPAAAPASAAGGERRVSLGSIPDYAFAGPGVRITGTMPGSPAEKAGLLAGDVIMKIGDTAVSGMQEFSQALKTFAPGDKIAVKVMRDGKPVTVEATLVARP
jgi:aminopeptidase N